MPIHIPESHCVFQTNQKMREICSPLFQIAQFSYFQYLRVYADGSIGALVTDSTLIQQFQQMQDQPLVFSAFEAEHEKSPFYWFSWDECLPTKPVSMARELCGFHHGMTLMRRNKDYYDMIGVALAQPIRNPASFYMSKMKWIEDFIVNFELGQTALINEMNQNPIWLPKRNRDVHYDALCIQEGKLAVFGKTKPTHLTTQELMCLNYALQGLSGKQIAKVMTISPKTVETYFARMKMRTGFQTMAELEAMLLKSV